MKLTERFLGPIDDGSRPEFGPPAEDGDDAPFWLGDIDDEFEPEPEPDFVPPPPVEPGRPALMTIDYPPPTAPFRPAYATRLPPSVARADGPRDEYGSVGGLIAFMGAACVLLGLTAAPFLKIAGSPVSFGELRAAGELVPTLAGPSHPVVDDALSAATTIFAGGGAWLLLIVTLSLALMANSGGSLEAPRRLLANLSAIGATLLTAFAAVTHPVVQKGLAGMGVGFWLTVLGFLLIGVGGTLPRVSLAVDD